jgi:hypothetical protein
MPIKASWKKPIRGKARSHTQLSILQLEILIWLVDQEIRMKATPEESNLLKANGIPWSAKKFCGDTGRETLSRTNQADISRSLAQLSGWRELVIPSKFGERTRFLKLTKQARELALDFKSTGETARERLDRLRGEYNWREYIELLENHVLEWENHIHNWKAVDHAGGVLIPLDGSELITHSSLESDFNKNEIVFLERIEKFSAKLDKNPAITKKVRQRLALHLARVANLRSQFERLS